MKQAISALCPCGNALPYAQCCEVWHKGVAAPSAELLMRSRYTAFSLQLASYLLETWHPSTRPSELVLFSEPTPKWISLTVKECELISPTEATVEFIARYKIGGRAYRLHEKSLFLQEQGCWYYVKGHLFS